MYLTTEQLRKRLSQIHPSIEQYWPSLGILVDEAHAAGRQEGIEIGRNQAAAERVCGRQSPGLSESGGEIVAKD